MGQEGNSACGRHPRRKRGIEPARGPDPPEAVGTQDPDGLVAEPRPELGLARLTGLAGLPKSRGEHDRAADAFRDTVLQGWQDSRRRDRDHRQVDGLADGQEGSGCREPLDNVRPRVHGPDAALESGAA
jgi:hypothetical protein